MDDEWDLRAVVKRPTTAAINTAQFNNTIIENPLPDFSSLIFQNSDPPFNYPPLAHQPSFQFQGLDEIYKDFISQQQPPPPPPPPINPTYAVPFFGGLVNQQPQLLPPPPPLPQIPQQQQLMRPLFNSNSLTGSSSQTGGRSRKRKNHQTKLVRQMTREELLADSWAWRKYGQKPIKGTPNPRNYYRCSTSKGCAARKQVEKSPSDPNIYVVYYSGEHTHPRPTQRNSLAGTTRNKFSNKLRKPISGEAPPPSAAIVPNPSCSSSSPVSAASSFSPSTPLMEGESVPHDNTQSQPPQNNNNNNNNGYAEMEENSENDDDILIPNILMSEDIIKGFQELSRGYPGCNGLDSRYDFGGKFSTRFPAP
ncbi:hypothetical protein ACSBR1_008513 [Camellia fascicularis]